MIELGDTVSPNKGQLDFGAPENSLVFKVYDQLWNKLYSGENGLNELKIAVLDIMYEGKLKHV